MHKHTGTHLPRKDASEQVRKTHKKRLSFPFRQTETKLSRKEKPEPDEAPTGADLPFKRNRSYPPPSLTPTSTRLTRQSFRAERVFPAFLSLSVCVGVMTSVQILTWSVSVPPTSVSVAKREYVEDFAQEPFVPSCSPSLSFFVVRKLPSMKGSSNLCAVSCTPKKLANVSFLVQKKHKGKGLIER